MSRNFKFDCLLIDPPWEYNNKRTGGSTKSGAAQKYETMPPANIQNLYDWLRLDDIMEKDCCLFLWTTNSMLPYALPCIDLWGFEFKTMITWVKPTYGIGYWYRGKTEHILFGVKGNVKPFRFNIPNIIMTQKKLAHSQKPAQSYELVENAADMVAFNKDKPTCILELFARKQYIPRNSLKRWTCIGNEISGNDIEKDIEILRSINRIDLKNQYG